MLTMFLSIPICFALHVALSYGFSYFYSLTKSIYSIFFCFPERILLKIEKEPFSFDSIYLSTVLKVIDKCSNFEKEMNNEEDNGED